MLFRREKKQVLPQRISLIVDNIQLLYCFTKNASYNIKQQGTISREMDFIEEAIKSSFIKGNEILRIAYQLNNISNVIHLINIFRNIIGIRQIIANLKEISTIVKKLC